MTSQSTPATRAAALMASRSFAARASHSFLYDSFVSLTIIGSSANVWNGAETVIPTTVPPSPWQVRGPARSPRRRAESHLSVSESSCTWYPSLGLLRDVLALRRQLVVDADVGRAPLLYDLDEAIPEGGVAFVACLQGGGVGLVECGEVLGHDGLVHRCDRIIVEALPHFVLSRFRDPRWVHGAVHVLRHVERQAPVAALGRKVHVLVAIADLPHRDRELRQDADDIVEVSRERSCRQAKHEGGSNQDGSQQFRAHSSLLSRWSRPLDTLSGWPH